MKCTHVDDPGNSGAGGRAGSSFRFRRQFDYPLGGGSDRQSTSCLGCGHSAWSWRVRFLQPKHHGALNEACSSSINRGDLYKTYDALASGALDILEKPPGDEMDGA